MPNMSSDAQWLTWPIPNKYIPSNHPSLKCQMNIK